MAGIFQVMFPSGAFGTSGSPGDRRSQRITSAASAATAALTAGRKYMIQVTSATSVRVRAGATAPTAVSTDLQLQAGGSYPYTPNANTSFLAFLPDAGTMEVFVWECEGAA